MFVQDKPKAERKAPVKRKAAVPKTNGHAKCVLLTCTAIDGAHILMAGDNAPRASVARPRKAMKRSPSLMKTKMTKMTRNRRTGEVPRNLLSLKRRRRTAKKRGLVGMPELVPRYVTEPP